MPYGHPIPVGYREDGADTKAGCVLPAPFGSGPGLCGPLGGSHDSRACRCQREGSIMKKRKKPETATNAKELLRELALLRGRVDEAAEQFSLGVKGRIDEILHILSKGEPPGAGHVLPEPR